MNLGDIAVAEVLKKLDATSPIPVASTGTVYTPSFPLTGVEAFEFLAASSGDVDILVELEEGADRPSTEEASDDNWAEPDGLSDIINVTDTSVHMKELSAPKGKYGRLKLTGQGTNHASTTLKIIIHRRETP